MPTAKPGTPEQLDFGDLKKREPPGPAVYTVTQIVQLASRHLETRFGDLWVEGEVSNLSRPTSGHVYFTLKDKRSQLAVVMFRAAATRLPFRIEDGQRLRCRGKLWIYDAQGRFQLGAEAAEPAGVGALQVAYEQLKKKLHAEGLFDPARKVPLPRLPRTIAVVTSPTGAALQDIIRVLHGRCPVRVVVCPTAVQGSEASHEIVSALRRADRLGADLVIVGRGGGSLEDLWAFNTEPVVRAIAAMRTPVISAVGHEVDVTLSDLAADQRAPTPSAAAEMAVPELAALLEGLHQFRARLVRGATQRLLHDRLDLERWSRRLGSPRGLLDRTRLRVDELAARVQAGTRRRLARSRDLLSALRSRLAANEPRLRLLRDRAALVALEGRLRAAGAAHAARRREALSRLVARLDDLSPLSILRRGYSLALDAGGRVVHDARALAAGDRLDVRFGLGRARCTVDAVVADEPEPGPGTPRS
jgi:exodeoxyribonuclease VII large subunit